MRRVREYGGIRTASVGETLTASNRATHGVESVRSGSSRRSTSDGAPSFRSGLIRQTRASSETF